MKRRISICFACFLSLALLLSGCGSSGKMQNTADIKEELSGDIPASYTYDAALPAFAYEGAQKTSSETPDKPAENAAASGRKLVKTMSFSIETQDFEKSTADIAAMVSAMGGYIENASVSGNSYRKTDTRTASYVLRIPVSSLAEFEGKIGSTGNVTSRSEQVKDITLNYTDTASRLKSLETQRDTLIEMMAKAEKLEDLLTIQDHLAEIEYELENYASQLRLYDNQVEYSSVSIKLTEVKIYTEPVTEPETFSERIAAAFKEGLESTGEFFKDLAIFLAGSLPGLLIFAVIIIVIVLLGRKAIKKRRAVKAAAKTAPIAETGRNDKA